MHEAKRCSRTELFSFLGCVDVLGVAGLGSDKGLEVFLSDLPDVVITQYTYFGETSQSTCVV